MYCPHLKIHRSLHVSTLICIMHHFRSQCMSSWIFTTSSTTPSAIVNQKQTKKNKDFSSSVIFFFVFKCLKECVWNENEEVICNNNFRFHIPQEYHKKITVEICAMKIENFFSSSSFLSYYQPFVFFFSPKFFSSAKCQCSFLFMKKKKINFC